MIKRIFLLLMLGCISALSLKSMNVSVAGFFRTPDSGREVLNFNNGWRFLRGDMAGAEKSSFDDRSWEVVAVPHSVQLMPAEGSGNRNYQGIAWYRKTFVVPTSAEGKDVTLHFEAIMGKQQFYVNGKLVQTHLGGYQPITINLTSAGVQAGDTCVIAVKADNSDDRSFPPGKTQLTLDFAYHGGIYRDVWMIIKNKVAITDAIESNTVAGGGVFVHYDKISDKSADINIITEVKNNTGERQSVVLETTLIDKSGKVIRKFNSRTRLLPGQKHSITQQTTLLKPNLWSPVNPYLYELHFQLRDGDVNLDGGMIRIGIREAVFRGKEGFFLNGKPYGQLIGSNRHQDFAYVGNAVPNSQQWRDAKRLRDAGSTIVRTAHYPMDPAFMDACDELGIFVIVSTPGWQFWNRDSTFAELSYQYTRNMIRRDRNHPSVLMWEPILNETRFPLEFSLKALAITKEEYPYPGAPPAAADMHSAGVSEHYGVVYGWPRDEGKVEQPIFCREFGENVDDWYAHNNNNRAARHWGEKPMKVAALSLAKSYGELFQSTGQFIGGAQWHPFDHQRGYHPDPYWGGIFDAFRQPKYAYYMFKSQQHPDLQIANVETGPMVFVLNEMSPFSDSDVVVFSNCDSVRLTAYDGKRVVTKPVIRDKNKIPYAPVVFENQFDFWEMRDFTYIQKKHGMVSFLVEGIIGGKVVCSQKKMPSRRSTKLRLYIDKLNKDLVADGSDFVVVVAEVTDDNGNVRRLAKENVLFSIEGEGEIIGDASIFANPRQVEFGSAPVLIRSTTTPGTIKVKARVVFEGTHAPTSAEIEFNSIPSDFEFCHLPQERRQQKAQSTDASTHVIQISDEKKRELLKEVEVQQTEFGVPSK